MALQLNFLDYPKRGPQPTAVAERSRRPSRSTRMAEPVELVLDGSRPDPQSEEPMVTSDDFEGARRPRGPG